MINTIRKKIGVSGIKKLFMFLEKDIIEAPMYSPFSDFAKGELVVQDTATYPIFFRKDTGIFSEKHIVSDKSDYYENTISFLNPNESVQNHATVRALNNRKVSIVYIDNNCNIKLVRNLFCKVDFSTNGGYNFVCTGFSKKKSSLLESYSYDDICLIDNSGDSNNNQTGNSSIELLQNKKAIRFTFNDEVFDFVIIKHHNNTRHSLQIEKII